MLSLGWGHTRGIPGAHEKRAAAREFAECKRRGLPQSACRQQKSLAAVGINWVFPRLCTSAGVGGEAALSPKRWVERLQGDARVERSISFGARSLQLKAKNQLLPRGCFDFPAGGLLSASLQPPAQLNQPGRAGETLRGYPQPLRFLPQLHFFVGRDLHPSLINPR